MPGFTPDTMLVLWWGVAATAVAWVCLPHLMQLLGQTQFESVTYEDPAALEPTEDDPEYAKLYADLQQLGFVPLGIHRTICRYYAGHWIKTFRILTFATPQRDCFASVFRFFNGDPWRLGFLTALTDGGLVESANQLECIKVQEEGYWRWGFATPDRNELLRLHRELVEQYCGTAGCSVDHLSLEQLGDLVVNHEGRFYRKSAAATAFTQLGSTLIVIVSPALGLGCLVGWESSVVPLAMLAGTVRYLLVSIGVFRQATRQMRSEEAARNTGRQSSAV
jgi:hypothetical protein